MTNTPARKSDLGVRTASAIVMIAVAGTALWLGGWWWAAFVATVGIVAFGEWCRLSIRMVSRLSARAIWVLLGAAYIGSAAWMLAKLREFGSIEWILVIVGVVVATDVGAYFTGRAIGGPTIAPNVSPSKTWSGLAGGMFAAGMVGIIFAYIQYRAELTALQDYIEQHGPPDDWFMKGWQWGPGFLYGCGGALIAQSGDFLESWMKRRAGVKDSSRLIPAHGGLLDRVDGLLAVSLIMVIFWMGVWGGNS